MTSRAGYVLVALATASGVLRSSGASDGFVTVARADAHAKPSDATAAAVSGDGRFVAFLSNARLVPDDLDAATDIYVLDRQTGSVSLETPASDMPAGSASAPHLSATGRYLVFDAFQNSSSSALRTIMVRDRFTGITRSLLSRANPADGGSRAPRVSGDGRRVAFASTATTLVDGADANGAGEDVFLLDVPAMRLERISLDSAGRQCAAGASFAPAISADGRYVAFTSTAPIDEAPDGPARRNRTSDVFVRDTERNLTLRVSVAPGGGRANGSSYGAAISADGRYVAFVSEATNLVKDRDDNRASDIYVRDLTRNVTELVSRRVSGSVANGASRHPAISDDGRIVVFQSDASDLTCASRCQALERDINLVADVFARDRASGTTRRISRGAAPWMEPSIGPAVDGSGTVIAFSSRHPREAADEADDFDLFVWGGGP